MVTDGTRPFRCSPHSSILGRVPFNCISQCTIDSFVSSSQSCGSGRIAFQQAFNPPSACFAASLLSPVTSSQVPASRTTLTETTVRSLLCESWSSLPCFPSALPPGPEASSPRVSLHSKLSVECIIAAIGGPWDSSHSECSVRVPTL